MKARRFRRRVRVLLGRVVPMVLLVLLTIAVWLSTAYVCGRAAHFIPPESAGQLLRQWLPSIH